MPFRCVLTIVLLISWMSPDLPAQTAAASKSPTIIADQEAIPTIPWDAAGRYVGQEVFAVGKVIRTGKSRSGHNFLNFSNNFRDSLTVFIRNSNVGNYPKPPHEVYKGKMIKVRGFVYLHDNSPNIAASTPEVITVLPDDTPLPQVKDRPPLQRRDDGTFTLATFNVLNLFDEVDDPYRSDEGTPAKPRSELEAMALQLRSINADVLALQEVENRGYLERFFRVFVPELGYEHIVLIEGNDRRGIDVAIASRLPVGEVTSHRHLIFPDGDGEPMRFRRDLLRARIQPEKGKPFDVYVVHLKSKGGQDEGIDIRLGEARAIRSLFNDTLTHHEDAHFVICGDFNDTIDSEPLQTITGSGEMRLVNFLSDLPTGEKSVTYNQAPYLSMIDFILCSPGMAERYIEESYTIHPGSPETTGSDHNAVVARFKLEAE